MVRELTARGASSALDRADAMRARSQQRQVVLGVILFFIVCGGALTIIYTRQSVNVPLRRLVSAAERFGAGDLRPVQLGEMPRELNQLAVTIDTTGARLRAIVEAVVREADQIATSAGEFSAMSQELAASGNEISTAMVQGLHQR